MSSSKTTIVVSDIHIGSPHFQRDKFNRFLDSLGAEVRLILNGDTLDQVKQPLASADRQILERLLPGNSEFETVWIEVNHDNAVDMKKKWQLDMHAEYRLEPPLNTLILHGVCFDTIGNRLKHGVRLFRILHHMRIKFGFTSIHFAEYAKRWRLMYNLMCGTVRKNAVRHAEADAVNTVVCGHVHKNEDVMVSEIRYINTGAWTEKENYYLEINGQNMKLRKWE